MGYFERQNWAFFKTLIKVSTYLAIFGATFAQIEGLKINRSSDTYFGTLNLPFKTWDSPYMGNRINHLGPVFHVMENFQP